MIQLLNSAFFLRGRIMETICFLFYTFLYFLPLKQRHFNVWFTWLTICHMRASTKFCFVHNCISYHLVHCKQVINICWMNEWKIENCVCIGHDFKGTAVLYGSGPGWPQGEGGQAEDCLSVISIGCFSFPGPKQHERKAGPETLGSNPWLCSSLPKLAESKSKTKKFYILELLGIWVPLSHFYMSKGPKRLGSHVHLGPMFSNSCSSVGSFLQGPNTVDIDYINEIVRGPLLDP